MHVPPRHSRRAFLQLAAGAAATLAARAHSQVPGERPVQAKEVSVLNPRARLPVGLIIDDSTCLVNLNRFAMPQFDRASTYANKIYHANWRKWPHEIPDV